MDRDWLAGIALGHDTAMARALLRALRWPRPWVFRPRRARSGTCPDGRFEGLEEAFENRGSPMDRPL